MTYRYYNYLFYRPYRWNSKVIGAEETPHFYVLVMLLQAFAKLKAFIVVNRYVIIFFSIFILSTVLLVMKSSAQCVRISELRCRPGTKFYNTKDSTIVYPIIVTENSAAGRLINKAIKAAVLEMGADDKSKTTREAMRRMIEMGLTDMSYEVAYNKNGILSLEIDFVVEAAYPNPSQVYFNFDVRTGKTIGIRGIISDSLFGQFQAKVFMDKVDSLEEYKQLKSPA